MAVKITGGNNPEDKRKQTLQVLIQSIMEMSPEELDQLQLETILGQGPVQDYASGPTPDYLIQNKQELIPRNRAQEGLQALAQSFGALAGDTDVSPAFEGENRRRLQNQAIERRNQQIEQGNLARSSAFQERKMNQLMSFMSRRRDDLARDLAKPENKDLQKFLYKSIQDQDIDTALDLMESYTVAFDSDPNDEQSQVALTELKTKLRDLAERERTEENATEASDETWKGVLTNLRGLRANALIVNLRKPPSILAVQSVVGQTMDYDPNASIAQQRERIFEEYKDYIPAAVQNELRILDEAYLGKTQTESEERYEKRTNKMASLIDQYGQVPDLAEYRAKYINGEISVDAVEEHMQKYTIKGFERELADIEAQLQQALEFSLSEIRYNRRENNIVTPKMIEKAKAQFKTYVTERIKLNEHINQYKANDRLGMAQKLTQMKNDFASIFVEELNNVR